MKITGYINLNLLDSLLYRLLLVDTINVTMSSSHSRKDLRAMNGSTFKEECEDHSEVLEYWCKEDRKLVCKECLIFGEHKGHTAIKQVLRSAKIMDTLFRFLPSLQAELARNEEAGKNIKIEGSKQLGKLKAEVSVCLDNIYAQEEREMTSQLSAHCARLQKTISSIQSLQAGLHSSPDDQLDLDTVARLVSQSVQVQVLPGSVGTNRNQTSLTVKHPTFSVATADSSSNVKTSGATSRPSSSSLASGIVNMLNTTPISSPVPQSQNLQQKIVKFDEVMEISDSELEQEEDMCQKDFQGVKSSSSDNDELPSESNLLDNMCQNDSEEGQAFPLDKDELPSDRV